MFLYMHHSSEGTILTYVKQTCISFAKNIYLQAEEM
jgi:hypothetical protein